MLDALDPSRLADQPVRRRLLALIETSPGIHASQLCREAGEPWGTVQYHLALLHKGELVRAVAAGRERRFFPPGMEDGRMHLLALLNQGRRHEVASFIRDHPGTRQVDVCDALDLARKTFRRAISPLVGEGLVHEKRGLHSNRYFPQGGLDQLLGPAAPQPPMATPGPDSFAGVA
jgi:predicted transcriptional regulator